MADTDLLGNEDVTPVPGREDTLSEADAAEIATDGYIYGFPLVLMEITRQAATNVGGPGAGGIGTAPMNQFGHAKAFPDASFTDVVRPNADTLYSTAWFDVSREPLVIQVPDSRGRYYLLPMLDMWTDVFSSPGKRTTGTESQTLVIADANWHGDLPRDVTLIRAPTSTGWILGRTQTNGQSDYKNVHRFQAGISAIPLWAWGSYYEPAKGPVDASASKAPPLDQVMSMDGATFFSYLARLLSSCAPHANDYPMLHRLARLGLVAGRTFDPTRAPREVKSALDAAPGTALPKIKDVARFSDVRVNGWSMMTNPVGTYGTAYLRRAAIAFGGLGANLLEDAFYAFTFADADGRPLASDQRYLVHFDKSQLPPVRAFWSLTVYNDAQAFADNPINRYAIGDRDGLQLGADGSLDIYVQRATPGSDRERNWLPTPATGGFTMNLRLYWPTSEATEGRWQPPPVTRVT
jgi:hypothetical protein